MALSAIDWIVIGGVRVRPSGTLNKLASIEEVEIQNAARGD